jgi:hypothetical protein
VQSGIALRLLCLNLGDVLGSGAALIFDDLAVARITAQPQVGPPEHETAINHRHPLLIQHRKAVTGWTSQWRTGRLSAAATHPSETVLVKSGGQDWLSASGTFGIRGGHTSATSTSIL